MFSLPFIIVTVYEALEGIWHVFIYLFPQQLCELITIIPTLQMEKLWHKNME